VVINNCNTKLTPVVIKQQVQYASQAPYLQSLHFLGIAHWHTKKHTHTLLDHLIT